MGLWSVTVSCSTGRPSFGSTRATDYAKYASSRHGEGLCWSSIIVIYTDGFAASSAGFAMISLGILKMTAANTSGGLRIFGGNSRSISSIARTAAQVKLSLQRDHSRESSVSGGHTPSRASRTQSPDSPRPAAARPSRIIALSSAVVRTPASRSLMTTSSSATSRSNPIPGESHEAMA